jgi:hypothetical protein
MRAILFAPLLFHKGRANRAPLPSAALSVMQYPGEH